jgi:hypothetical protein
MNTGGECFGSAQKPTVLSEDLFSVVRRLVHVDKSTTTYEKVE